MLIENKKYNLQKLKFSYRHYGLVISFGLPYLFESKLFLMVLPEVCHSGTVGRNYFEITFSAVSRHIQTHLYKLSQGS